MKLTDALVFYARLAGEVVERSTARPLSACLESVDSPVGRERVAAYLQSQPFPHYEPHPAKRGLLERIEDGTRTVGRFVNREFKGISARKSTSRKTCLLPEKSL